jgi:putative acetyltransferase
MTQHRSIAFRGFSWDHMPALSALWVESWQEAMPEIDFEARRGWICHRIGTLLGEGAVIEIATTEPVNNGSGDILGFVTVHPRTGYIDQLVVDPDHWGEGIAIALIEAARRYAPLHLSLDVNEENGRAVRFYQKAGFTVTSHGVNPVSGRPTLRMDWRIRED